jgi:tRNA A37 threonylcarbamoyladenosine modification protein TsaB
MSLNSGIWVALECSDRQARIAIKKGEEVIECSLDEGQSQTTHLIPVLKATLEKHEIGPASVEHLALNVGPGSAMGLRMGVVLAQGWSFVHPSVSVHAIPFEACAQQALLEWGKEGGASKAVLLADAFGGEVFLQEIERTGEAWELKGKMLRHPRKVISSLRPPLRVLENLGPWKEKLDWHEELVTYSGKLPTAIQVLRAALTGEFIQAIEDIDVRYLKPSSAELLWEKRQSEKGS